MDILLGWQATFCLRAVLRLPRLVHQLARTSCIVPKQQLEVPLGSFLCSRRSRVAAFNVVIVTATVPGSRQRLRCGFSRSVTGSRLRSTPLSPSSHGKKTMPGKHYAANCSVHITFACQSEPCKLFEAFGGKCGGCQSGIPPVGGNLLRSRASPVPAGTVPASQERLLEAW